MINVAGAVRAGLLGGAAMEAGGWLAHRIGLSRLSMSLYEGSMLTGRTNDPAVRAAGVGGHLLLSTMIALPYALVMERTRRAAPVCGAELGVLHWLIAGLVLPGMDALNPSVRAGQTPPLKVFATGYGGGAVVTFLIGHLLYGAALGAAYDLDGG